MRGTRIAAFAAAAALTLAAVAFLRGGEPVRDPSLASLAVASAGPGGATNLSLAPDLSFTDDSSANFPIRGDGISDGQIASDRPTVIFFGTAHCWNTNREAERFVALYGKHRNEARFIVVDLEHASADQHKLVARFYRGYIPTLTFLDRKGGIVYNRAGETARERGDVSGLEKVFRVASGR